MVVHEFVFFFLKRKVVFFNFLINLETSIIFVLFLVKTQLLLSFFCSKFIFLELA